MNDRHTKPKSYWVSLGQRIKRRRKALGLTQGALGELCDPPTSGSSICNIENAQVVPYERNQKRIMLALSILEGADDPAGGVRKLAVVKPKQPEPTPVTQPESLSRKDCMVQPIHPVLVEAMGACGIDSVIRVTVRGLSFEVRYLGESK